MNISEHKEKGDFLLWASVILAVTIFYHLCLGLQTVNPTYVDWLMMVHHDWGQHYLGWYFFRVDPWTFPIGNMHSIYYPLGTNIGFMDAAPGLGKRTRAGQLEREQNLSSKR